MRRQAREVRKCYRRIAELRAEHARFLMRQLQKVIEDTEFVHHFERRRMNGVAAEVAQKIGVLLEHENVDPGPREQKREHHPRGSATRDTAARGELFHGDSVSPPEVAVEMTNVDAGGALVSSSEARHFQRSSQSSRTAEASENGKDARNRIAHGVDGRRSGARGGVQPLVQRRASQPAARRSRLPERGTLSRHQRWSEVPRDLRTRRPSCDAQQRVSRRGALSAVAGADESFRRIRWAEFSAQRVSPDLSCYDEPDRAHDGDVAVSADGAHGYPGRDGGGVQRLVQHGLRSRLHDRAWLYPRAPLRLYRRPAEIPDALRVRESESAGNRRVAHGQQQQSVDATRASESPTRRGIAGRLRANLSGPGWVSAGSASLTMAARAAQYSE